MQKKKVGRPKKTIDDLNLPKDWQSIALRLYEDGKSDVHVRVELDINHRQFYNLLEDNEEFRETIKKGHELSLLWWMDKGQDNLDVESGQGSVNLNYTGWYMQMKNRFGWSDNQKIQVEHSGQITHKNIDAKIKELSDRTPEQVIAELAEEIQDDFKGESQS